MMMNIVNKNSIINIVNKNNIINIVNNITNNTTTANRKLHEGSDVIDDSGRMSSERTSSAIVLVWHIYFTAQMGSATFSGEFGNRKVPQEAWVAWFSIRVQEAKMADWDRARRDRNIVDSVPILACGEWRLWFFSLAKDGSAASCAHYRMRA